MTKIQSNVTNVPKHLSPELAEVLHMLKSLEAQPVLHPIAQTSR